MAKSRTVLDFEETIQYFIFKPVRCQKQPLQLDPQFLLPLVAVQSVEAQEPAEAGSQELVAAVVVG